MVAFFVLLSAGLFATVAHGQYGQSVAGQGYEGLGQSDVTFQQPERAREFPGGQAFAVPPNHRQNGFAEPNQNAGQQNGYSQAVPNVGEQFTNYNDRNGGFEVGQGRGLSQPMPLPNLERGYRNLRSLNLGQTINQPNSGGLGQNLGHQPNSGGLGQNLGHQPNSGGLGQNLGHQPNSGGLGQNLNQHGHLRAKRYSNREPYQKSCNSYYGKYICYRVYEKDANIPHDFTCWSLYLGQKNCTETENVLYLDRRNVEVDASELDRRFFDQDDQNDRRQQQAGAFARQSRTRDDEFGAIEKGMHNRRNDERTLPVERNDRGRIEDTRNVRVYDDRELRDGRRS